MVRYAEAEVAGDEPATRRARGRHMVLLEPADRADLLRTALPQIHWEQVGTDWTLLYGDFFGLLYAFATRGAVSTFVDAFDATSPNMGLVDRSWKEVLKAMTPDDWTPTEWGMMVARMAAAGSRPSVDPAAIVVFEGADGRADRCAPAIAGVVPGAIAGGEGAAYLRPLWLARLTWADGMLANGVSLLLASDAAYYAETWMAAECTLVGSPFWLWVEQMITGAVADAVRGGADDAQTRQRSPRALAALVARYMRESAWPKELHVYSNPGVPRELDLIDQHACAHVMSELATPPPPLLACGLRVEAGRGHAEPAGSLRSSGLPAGSLADWPIFPLPPATVITLAAERAQLPRILSSPAWPRSWRPYPPLIGSTRAAATAPRWLSTSVGCRPF